jgi:hypothetical protein
VKLKIGNLIMRLPNSEDNVNLGIYFYTDPHDLLWLLKINGKDDFYYRKAGGWHRFENIEEFWRNPSDFQLNSENRTEAILCFDRYESLGEIIPGAELKKFISIY